jgi:uncharacterized membrane protein (UPF0127 family)
MHYLKYFCVFIVIFTFNSENGFARSGQLEPLQIKTSDQTYSFQVEVARTPQEQARGLMFRQSMPENHGMLFDFNELRRASFWMKNTYIPLDLLFIEANGTINSIIENAQPLSLKSLKSEQPVRAVLEINGGLSARLNIKPGDTVQHTLFANAN